MKKLPTVVLIGRVNVGKSTLFNKLIGTRKALESPVEGTTRDYNQGIVNWRDSTFALVDTGGFINYSPEEEIAQETLEFAEAQARTGDLIIFLVDYKDGLAPFDLEIYNRIKKLKKTIIVAINKVDKINKRDESILDFAALGTDNIIPISAVTGQGTGDLLDMIVNNITKIDKTKLKISDKNKITIPEIKMAIVGQPNVGKSSILNIIVGKKRAIVSSTPHTTRDSHDEIISFSDHLIQVIDTAGIRRRTAKGDLVEKFSIDLAMRNLKRSNVALLVLDINQPITYQDKHLAEKIIETGNSVIIIANKWDLIPDKETNTINEFTDYIYKHMPYLDWAPIVFTSANRKQRITNILKLALAAYQERFRKIDDNALDKFIKKIIKIHKPSRGKGVAHPYIYRLRQVNVNPPFFELTIKYQKSLHPSYVRFVENQLREQFGFQGTPIKIYINSIK